MAWAGYLKQSTAATIKLGQFVDSGDGNTAETGLTLSQADIRLSKNGGDFAQKNQADAATHDELGYYDCSIDTTDTGTCGSLRVVVHESGALAVDQSYTVIPANIYDSFIAGTDYQQVDAMQIEGGDATDALTAAVPTAATIADAVWDEASTGHTDAGKAGAQMWTDIDAILADTGTDGVVLADTYLV